MQNHFSLKQKIQNEIDSNVQMFRSKDPKSERRMSVLSARIEMLTWVQKELDEATKQIQDKVDACGDTTIRSMHDNVKAKLAIQNRKEALKEVLTILDGDKKP